MCSMGPMMRPTWIGIKDHTMKEREREINGEKTSAHTKHHSLVSGYCCTTVGREFQLTAGKLNAI